MAITSKFRHLGRDVVAAARSAGREDEARTFACCGWAKDQDIWKVGFDLPSEILLDRIARGGIVDPGPVR